MKKYNYKWIDFLSGSNTVKIQNKNDFEKFKTFLQECGLIEILGKNINYSDWQTLAIINNKNKDIFLFEYNNDKGLTWWDSEKESIEWYEKTPIKVTELQEFFDKKINENIKSVKDKGEYEINYDY